MMKCRFLLIATLVAAWQYGTAQSYSEILGRPTDSTITMSLLADQTLTVYWEIGTTPGNYSISTTPQVATANNPLEFDFTGLLPNTRYYYRLRYTTSTGGVVYAGAEHTFHTRRPPGSSFKFAVEADPHLDTNTIPASYTLTLQNMLSAQPDFVVDLGDNFMSEKEPVVNLSTITARTKLFRPYFGEVCHSAPLYLTIGNHEGELGWKLTGSDTSMPVLTTNVRKLYYPNPYPNSFYSGNTTVESYVGLRENYYAWEWGDALFVVIDPYWYTTASQRAGWGWTLGSAQYNWFKNTIINSSAKFKFVFCHQLVGGNGNDARGGAEYVDLFEMGGKNTDSSWGFATNRPGWSDPIHQLLINHNGSIYFHGHDHFYGRQQKDCIVYQEVPQPSAKNINNNLAPGYGYLNGVFLPSRGYLLVTVNTDSVKVDYVKTFLPNEENGSRHNKDIAHSYTIGSCGSGLPLQLSGFNAYEHNSQNYLEWTTANEYNTSHFDIERSEDGISFSAIGNVASVGNATVAVDYRFTDKFPPSTLNYYRLKQFDKDGKFSYSKIVMVDNTKASVRARLYPNPAHNSTRLELSFPTPYDRLVVISDISGRTISRQVLPKGQTTLLLELSNIGQGVYLVSVPGGNERVQMRLVVR